MKIKSHDQVKMMIGRSKGKTGKVLRVFPDENKVIVEGMSLVKKHIRPRKEGEKGQRVELPGKVNISNVMLVCSKCGKATRVGYKTVGENKVRVCKKCQAEI